MASLPKLLMNVKKITYLLRIYTKAHVMPFYLPAPWISVHALRTAAWQKDNGFSGCCGMRGTFSLRPIL
jgi:hypothetical protein